MAIWSAEIKELTALYNSFRGKLPEVEKEFEKLIKTDDENSILLYSRRCLEVIVTDLCEKELGRPRKTEPLKGIIDKLHKEEKVPPHIITSMQNLNSVATFGAHPIEFNPQQVRTVLIDMATIIGWFLTYHNIGLSSTHEEGSEKDTEAPDAHVVEVLKEGGKGKESGKKRKKVKRAVWIGSLAINIIFVLVIINALKPVPFTEEDWLIITDFENLTGDDVFNQSLNAALEVGIQQSSFVNVFPRSRINETLQRMGKEKTEIINEDIGIEIAQREGIPVIVVCKISLLGNVYLLSAQVVEVNSRKVLKTETFQANGKNEILVNLDNLSRKIRRDLGESFREINNKIVPLPEATTSSLEALKYLVKGQEAWGKDGQSTEAINLFLKATELDPEFALAHAYLGSLYYWVNNRTKGEEHFTKALNQLDRLTEKEKQWIQARVEGFRGNYDNAVVKYNIYLRNYPSAPDGWYQLGYNQMMLGRYEEAIAAFNKSLEFYHDKEPNAYINLATCYSALEKYQQSQEFYLKGFALNSNLLTVPNLNHEFGFTYVQMGEYQKAMEVFDKMIEGSDEHKARGYRSQALLLMYTGKFSEAIEILHKSVIIQKTLGNRTSELRDHMFLASAYKIKRMTPEFLKELNKADKLLKTEGMEPWWLFLYGKILIRDGKTKEAQKVLNEISLKINQGNRSDKAAFNILKGEIELTKGNFAEALDSIETGVRFRNDNYTLESLAYCYYKTGNSDMAVAKYQEIIKRKNELGWEAQEYWILAHLKLGMLNEEKGNPEQAKKYYQDFLNIWKDADSDLPEFIEAKSRLAKLQEQL